MACIPVYKGKRFPSTEKLLQYLSTEEGIMAHLADGKDTEFLKAIEGAVSAAEKAAAPAVAPLAGTTFKTAKGSVYTYLPDGRTQRFKTATNEQNEPQDLTVFVKFKDAEQEQDFLEGIQRSERFGTKVYLIDQQGNKYDTNEQAAGKDVRLVLVKDGKVIDTVETSLTPQIGYNTFDQRRFKKDGENYREAHLGNKVTEINPASETTPNQSPTQQIADLRAKEQAEYDAMPDPNDEAKRKEIYDRYDGPITKLLAEEEAIKQQTNDNKNKQGVSGEVGVGQESVQAQPVEGGGTTKTQAGGNVQGNEKAEVKPTVEEKLSMDDFDSFKDAVAYNVGRTAKIGLDESGADYGTNQDISAISPILEKAGIPIEKVEKSKMADGNYASFDGSKIKITESNIPLPVLLHEIGEYVIDGLDKAKIKIKHSNNIFEAVTTYGASRGNDAFADNFYLYFLSPETLKDLSPNVYKELDMIIPEKVKALGKDLMKVYGAKEQTLKYNGQKTIKQSPLTAFQTKGEAGRKAREALKEEVGPEEFRRIDNIHRNGEKMLKALEGKGILEIRCP